MIELAAEHDGMATCGLSVDQVREALAEERAQALRADAQARSVLECLRAAGVQLHRAGVDSRTLVPGDLFLALPGARADGRAHIGSAIGAGAAAVLWEQAGAPAVHLPDTVAGFAVDGLAELVGSLASRLAGEPSRCLWMIGVTGTNGKTSVSQWVAEALAEAGRPTAVVGTLGMGFPGEDSGALNTTPEACTLQAGLSRLLDRGAAAVAMEASSIGLDQRRTRAVEFDCAVFTNLTRDHLDYHVDMGRYALAKARLFATPTLSHAVINLDDPFGRMLVEALRHSGVRCIGYSLEPVCADTGATVLQALDTGVSGADQCFTLACAGERHAVRTAIAGRFNVSNLLAVAGALQAAGLSLRSIADLLGRLRPVRGRMERLGGERQPLVLVDYAHTPDALERVLQAGRELARARGGQLVVVFGCGGERDVGKRPQMGALAVRLADRVLITSDNPRSEPPQTIIDAILLGVEQVRRDAPPQTSLARCTAMIDRASAIDAAVAEADARDVVVLAGKGHESWQETLGRREPFSDLEQARRALAGRSA